MKRTASLLLLTVVLAGCSTVGNVLRKTGQVLMDPSIQVGSAENQPTQIALSLYADPLVNPNPAIEGGNDEAKPEQVADSPAVRNAAGQYAVQLQSSTRTGLIEALEALLGQLETGDAPRPGGPGAAVAADGPWPPLPVGLPRQSERVLAKDKGATAAPGPLPRTGDLGQYRDGQAIPDAPPLTRVERYVSTPVPFKIVQLKDDSVLLNADPSLLRDNLKKTLGSTYLNADDYLLAPGQFKFINYADIDKDTRFIAVVADFHDANPEAIKQVFRVEPRGRKYALLITLGNTRAAITDESLPTPQVLGANSPNPDKKP
ncbi:type VI secretion system lipoprotein TssJ [Burkholderia sp. Bp8963]|uniref:type VI secretion system lipoprotein TssJ n=1 Tax=Burkholderia sp. Bp8963 TaxID=2184547 RepID=UPI000F59B410|nr:type VI secretion system lipoprotein TssJ [Burkholderia sp. Bp8963]RQS75470.1 type VI secretion system lipoprotein TssJ [Burkholderia sp. Bp8963]